MHGKAIFAYFARRADRIDDVADLVADVYLVAWRRIEDVPASPDRALFWLYSQARGVLANHHRSEARRRNLADHLRERVREVVGDASSGSLVPLGEVMEGLPHADREVLCLLGWEGLTNEQTAEVLGITTASVRKRAERARRRLRQALDRV